MKIVFDKIQKERVDRYLSNEFPKKSREFFNRLIRNEKVLVNENIVKPSFVIKSGDVIEIDDESLNKTETKELISNKDIQLDIVFENDDFLIINKPSGILVHGTGKNESDTIANALIYLYPTIKEVGDDLMRPGIVHRLDRDTSGLLMVAKNSESFLILKNMFQNHEIQKTYLALVFGKLKNKVGVIDSNLKRSDQKFNRQKIELDQSMEGRTAITEYMVMKEFEETSLVKVTPKTGRTHQIRVHFASISNFIIGDMEYGSKKINKKYGLARQFLHASELNFNFKGVKYSFKSELPLELKEVLEKIEND